MTRSSYRAVWAAEFARREPGLRQVLSMDPYDNWETNRMPEGTTEDGVIYALAIMYAEPESELARRFLRQSQEVAARVIAEDKLQSRTCAPRFPGNRGRFLRARTYCVVLLTDQLDVDALHQATRDYEEWCHDMTGRDWDEVSQANQLAGARVSLLAGDLEQALRLLKDRRRFKYHNEEAKLLLDLAEGAATAETPSKDDALLTALDAFFDRVRDPAFKSDVFREREILRFELGAIRDKYFISPDRTIDWRRTIEAISA